MGLRVCDLPSIRWQKVRVFELKSRADLEHQRTIHLRGDLRLATIARQIGIHPRNLRSIGITEKGINIRKLGRALDTGTVAPALHLREGETKDADLLLSVIAGRLGREAETLDLDIYRAMESITDEKVRIQLASNYFRTVREGRDPPSCASLLFTIGRLCHPENPAGQKIFILSVLKDNFRYSSQNETLTAGELTVLTARSIYTEDIPAQLIMISNAAQIIYNKRGYGERGKLLGRAARALFPNRLSEQTKVVLKMIPQLDNLGYAKMLSAEDLAEGLLKGLALVDSPERDDFIVSITRHLFPILIDSQVDFICVLARQLYQDTGQRHFIYRIASKLYPEDNNKRDHFLQLSEERGIS